MIKVLNNKKEYFINKEKLRYVLSRLEDSDIKDEDMIYLMKKYKLDCDEVFLENINKI